MLISNRNHHSTLREMPPKRIKLEKSVSSMDQLPLSDQEMNDETSNQTNNKTPYKSASSNQSTQSNQQSSTKDLAKLKRNDQSSSKEERFLVLDSIIKSRLIDLLHTCTISLQVLKIESSTEKKMIKQTDDLIQILTSLRLKINNSNETITTDDQKSMIISDLSLNLRDKLISQLIANKTIILSSYAYTKDDKLKLVADNSLLTFDLMKLPVYEIVSNNNDSDDNESEDEDEIANEFGEIDDRLKQAITLLNYKINSIDIYKKKVNFVAKFKLADLINSTKDHYDNPFFCGGVQFSIYVKRVPGKKDKSSVDYIGCYLETEYWSDEVDWSYKVKVSFKILAKSSVFDYKGEPKMVVYNNDNSVYGTHDFIKLDYLANPTNNLLYDDDKFKVEVDLQILKATRTGQD